MKKGMLIGLLILTGVVGGLHALPAVQSDPLIVSVSGAVQGIDLPAWTVEKRQHADSVYLRVADSSGREIWHSAELGSEDRSFLLDGRESKLALCDLDGDGRLEIVTAAFYGPVASGMYVFRYDPQEKVFSQVMWRFENQDLNRDALVSDLPSRGGQDLELSSVSGEAGALGMIYPETADHLPRPGSNHFPFRDGRFVHTRTVPLPQ